MVVGNFKISRPESLLIIANYLFEKYSKLSSIVKDKYKFIVDKEAEKVVKKIFNMILSGKSKKETSKKDLDYQTLVVKNIYTNCDSSQKFHGAPPAPIISHDESA